jgi:TonB dependent receptor/Carboxypeptidase regulatory-like domain/TonB-dependent Receptor Plug Domain
MARTIHPRGRRCTKVAIAAALALACPRFALAQEPAEDETEAPAAEDAPATEDAPAAPPKQAEDSGAAPAPPAKQAEEAEPEPTAEELAEMEAAEAELAGEDMSKPPAAGKGAVWGVVTDTKFAESIIDATVQVVGRKEKTLTDVDGRYRLELPPGTYAIRVSYELHQPTRVDQVVVTLGKLNRVDLTLVPDENAVEEVVIEEDADRTSLEGQTLQRRRSASVGDGVGRAEISRTPDRNAAEAAQRVVGATIVGSRFVFVRGLGERYTNSLLNGTPLPSPEPDRQSVPLDLFPALVLDSITITKQFTPDMPADFAGGSVRINTREFPRQTLFQLSLSGGYDSQSTFRNRVSSRGGSTDFLGFDDGKRALPALPNKRVDPQNSTDEERTDLGLRLNSFRSTTRARTPPNHGLSVVAGDAFKLGKAKKLGLIGALTYSRSYQRRRLSFQRFKTIDVQGTTVPFVSDFGEGLEGIDTVRWGAFGSAALELSKNDKLALTALRSQSGTKLDSEFEAFRRNAGGTFRGIHLEYVTRQLNFGQLRGEHRLPVLADAEVEWHLDLASAARDQPDTRDTLYRRSDPPDALAYSWSPGSDSGQHFFSDQQELTKSVGLDWTQPFVTRPKLSAKLKVGTLLTAREREFSARRFVFVPDGRGLGELTGAATCTGVWQSSCPDRLFGQDLIGPDLLLPRESTLVFDEYDASLGIYAGYAMVDVELSPVRVIGGMRIEGTNQTLTAWDPHDRENTSERAILQSTDYLPAVSVVYAVMTKSNARLGVGRTLARPQLREIAPFSSSSYTAELPTQGNPDLKLTKITNVDLRFEHFPTLREVLAVSVFFKDFTDPIEEVIVPSSQEGLITYRNADGATLWGVELEARKTLGFLASALDDITAIGNLTLVTSRVDLGANAGVATNASRPLSYQSPYVVNLSLDYSNQALDFDVRLLYNVSGARIARVGSEGLPDTYELPRHTLDLTVAKKLKKKLELKASAQNLLGADMEFGYRGLAGYRLDDEGRPNPAGRNPYTSRYKLGRTVSLTASYTY